jgi:hypothetical protein
LLAFKYLHYSVSHFKKSYDELRGEFIFRTEFCIDTIAESSGGGPS